MKKTATVIIILLITLTSCAGGDIVSFIVSSGEFENVTDITVDSGDSVYFYVDEQVTSVSVNAMRYDEKLEMYVVERKIYSGLTLAPNDALKITLDLEREMPYVAVSYTRDTGEYREQFIYRDGDGNLYLLEQK